MGIQTTVNFVQGFGVPGELYDDGPVRCQPFVMSSVSDVNNFYGRAVTLAGGGVQVGGDSTLPAPYPYAGILVSPKSARSVGTSGNPLAPTLFIPNGTVIEVLNMGSIVVSLAAPLLGGAGNPGDTVIYQNTTGILTSMPVGSALPTGYSLASAIIDRFAQGLSPGLAVIRVTVLYAQQ